MTWFNKLDWSFCCVSSCSLQAILFVLQQTLRIFFFFFFPHSEHFFQYIVQYIVMYFPVSRHSCAMRIYIWSVSQSSRAWIMYTACLAVSRYYFARGIHYSRVKLISASARYSAEILRSCARTFARVVDECSPKLRVLDWALTSYRMRNLSLAGGNN